MEIMGGLLKLGGNNHVPIPWYMRSHLGLATGTRVHLALTRPESGQGILPDLIVSPLDPYHFHQTASVSVSVVEGVGALKGVLENIDRSSNIALADSVTIERRTRHRVNIVLEPAQGASGESHEQKVRAFINVYAPSASNQLVFDFMSAERNLYWMNQTFEVRDGFVQSADWLAPIKNEYKTWLKNYDLTKLVVSSNPDRRLLRYIIPKKGVFSIQVPHEDKPGVLRLISQEISKGGFNILASRLSRTPPPGSGENVSVFVAECEPAHRRAIAVDALARNIMSIDGHFIREPTISEGKAAEESVYLLPRNTRTARILYKDVEEKYRHLRASYVEPTTQFRPPRRKRVVFISRRFLEKKDAVNVQGLEEFNLVRRAMYEAIERANWSWIEAKPAANTERGFSEVYSRMWLADRFLIYAFFGDGTVNLSAPQGHELGFAMGQSKKVKILLPENKYHLFNFPNHPDTQLLTYKYPLALDATSTESLSSLIGEWLEA